jgi:hypothetical protein
MYKLKKYRMERMSLLIASLSFLFSFSGTALAGRHFAIITDWMKKNPAFFDVATWGAGTNIRYTVFQSTGDRVSVVPFINGFARSPNLFNIGGSDVTLPALVEAETVDANGVPDGINSMALVRQKTLIMPSPQTTADNFFTFPVGDVINSAHLVVGNVTIIPQTVAYSINGGPAEGFILLPFQVQDVPLTIVPPAMVTVAAEIAVVVAFGQVGRGQDYAVGLIPQTVP